MRKDLQVLDSGRIWLLIIDLSDRVNSTMTEICATAPDLPSRLLCTHRSIATERFYHDHAHVLWVIQLCLRAVEVRRSEQTESSCAKFVTLPSEILRQVIANLPELDRVTCALVSKGLYSLVKLEGSTRLRYSLPHRSAREDVRYLQDTMYMKDLILLVHHIFPASTSCGYSSRHHPIPIPHPKTTP